jgi:hypothetical protein
MLENFLTHFRQSVPECQGLYKNTHLPFSYGGHHSPPLLTILQQIQSTSNPQPISPRSILTSSSHLLALPYGHLPWVYPPPRKFYRHFSLSYLSRFLDIVTVTIPTTACWKSMLSFYLYEISPRGCPSCTALIPLLVLGCGKRSTDWRSPANGNRSRRWPCSQQHCPKSGSMCPRRKTGRLRPVQTSCERQTDNNNRRSSAKSPR